MINITVGFDQREAIAYHVFCQSVIDRSSMPVSFLPLSLSTLNGYIETHTDGSNSFIYSRFLTPWLHNFNGWSIFADGDMICNDDIAKLWALRDPTKAVLVAKHNYKTKAKIKYLGNKNEDYPKKNWSSLILWNCEHPKNIMLTPEFLRSKDGSYLHRFTWLSDEDIGEIPLSWNWLVTEYEDSYSAQILHYTLGTPCFLEYQDSNMSEIWRASYSRTKEGMGS